MEKVHGHVHHLKRGDLVLILSQKMYPELVKSLLDVDYLAVAFL